jgi:signal transduction histidine kinase
MKDLQALNQELHAAKEELEKVNRLKTHLLALTSHQLKTPIGIIRGYATLLREGFYGPLSDEVKEILSKIEFGTEEVVLLVDNIIDLRKVEEGRLQYQMQDIDFAKLARQTCEEMGHMAMSSGLNLNFSGLETELIIHGDAQKIQHVIQNIIDNAVKYTKKGSISIEVHQKDNNVLLSVTDSGIGINAKTIPFLFQEFSRDERIEKEIHGTGLGLYIARLFIEAHHGKIWAESEGEGKGSTFYISIPLK